MTIDQFKDAMAPLGAVAWKYGRGLTRPTMRLFWDAFKHHDPDLLAVAVKRHIETSSEFPTPHDLQVALDADDRSIVRAAVVLQKLLGAAPRYDPRKGDYWQIGDVMQCFGPQAVAAFLVAGGSLRFRDRTDQDMPFLRRDFLKGWEAYHREDRALQVAINAPPDNQPRGLAPAAESLARLLPPKEVPE